MPITIDKPSKYFNTKLYTGTGSSQSITSVGFKPDLTWLKGRDFTPSIPALIDSVRGRSKDLYSDRTSAEETSGSAEDLTSFDTDGFSLGTSARFQSNNSGQTFVSWNWLASNTTVSNTAGSISSTVSANTTSGFSVVSYTGTGSNATVGHGLGVAPSMIIVKNRNTVTNWFVYHSKLTSATYYINLNSTSAQQSGSTVWNSTAPTSTVFSLGTADSNTSSSPMIAYCFAEVKGYSKAFSYVGNGSSDGTYVNLGFRPAWLLIKRTDSAGYDWLVYDNKRQVEYNVVDDFLKPNLSDAETTGNAGQSLDFLSNGIKFRGTGASSNASGGTYIGFAIAEQPFVSSKGLPTTAR